MRAGADEEIGIVAGREVAQNLRDALGGQLPRSATARSKIHQAFFFARKQHVRSTKNRQDAKDAKKRRREK
jgi:hypothetical protein